MGVLVLVLTVVLGACGVEGIKAAVSAAAWGTQYVGELKGSWLSSRRRSFFPPHFLPLNIFTWVAVLVEDRTVCCAPLDTKSLGKLQQPRETKKLELRLLLFKALAFPLIRQITISRYWLLKCIVSCSKHYVFAWIYVFSYLRASLTEGQFLLSLTSQLPMWMFSGVCGSQRLYDPVGMTCTNIKW